MPRELTDRENRQANAVLFGIAFVIILALLWGSFYQVEAGHVSGIKRFGEVKRTTPAGLHMKFPIIEDVITFDTRVRRHEYTLAVASDELLKIPMIVAFNGRISEDNIAEILQNYGEPQEFIHQIVAPKLIQAAKATSGKYLAKDLINNRDQVATAMNERFKEAMKGIPFEAQTAVIVDLSLPEKLQQEIEAKQQAEQAAQRAEHELKKNEVDVKKRVQEAQADADAKRINAQGEADAKVIVAEGEAKAFRAKGAALKAFPQVLSQLRVEAWANGAKVPHLLVGANSGTDFSFILNGQNQ